MATAVRVQLREVLHRLLDHTCRRPPPFSHRLKAADGRWLPHWPHQSKPTHAASVSVALRIEQKVSSRRNWRRLTLADGRLLLLHRFGSLRHGLYSHDLYSYGLYSYGRFLLLHRFGSLCPFRLSHPTQLHTKLQRLVEGKGRGGGLARHSTPIRWARLITQMFGLGTEQCAVVAISKSWC